MSNDHVHPTPSSNTPAAGGGGSVAGSSLLGGGSVVVSAGGSCASPVDGGGGGGVVVSVVDVVSVGVVAVVSGPFLLVLGVSPALMGWSALIGATGSDPDVGLFCTVPSAGARSSAGRKP